MLQRYLLNMEKNVVFKGYSKLDSMAHVSVQPNRPTRILIALHHTIASGELNMSTFLKYYDFWQSLPKKYPNIEFVFRPHPLMRHALSNIDGWNEEKVNDYFIKLANNSNVVVQSGGSYYDIFVNSDGIINECGSFAAEYLMTDHPACYLMNYSKTNKRNFNPFMMKCLECHYQAFDEEDIYKFIDAVIINKNDYLYCRRKKFVDEQIKGEYPNVCKEIYKDIIKEIKMLCD